VSALEVARVHARQRAALAARLRQEAAAAWAKVDPAHISESWSAQIPRLLLLLAAGQHAAASSADEYVATVLAEQGLNPATRGRLEVASLTGIASDGRALESLLAQPGVVAKVALGGGRSIGAGMASGNALAQLVTHTQVADAGRVADQVAMASRPAATGQVRMVVGQTCSRCLILAGRWYRWDAGFDRHPKCDCIGVPGRPSTAGDLRTDPKAAFAAMDPAEQDRVFTKAGAEAIRLGADINQVVNVRRGAAGLTPAGARITAAEARLLRGGRDIGRLQAVDVFGRQLFVTTEGTTTRGVAGVRLGAKDSGLKLKGARYRAARSPRLMPESILQIAGSDRDEALRLLRRFGYIR
jgi:hypothetical protein